jgi:hypothetical protein
LEDVPCGTVLSKPGPWSLHLTQRTRLPSMQVADSIPFSAVLGRFRQLCMHDPSDGHWEECEYVLRGGL